MTDIKKIIESAIPLTPDCDIKRKNEIERRARLRMDIEELIREEKKKQPYQPDLEYKGYPNKGNPSGFH